MTKLNTARTLEELTSTLVKLESFLELEQRRYSKTVSDDMVELVNELMDDVQAQKHELVEELWRA